MEKLAKNPGFYRFLEIFPGVLSWTLILLPIIFSFFKPIWVGVFILIYAFYWLCKTINISRHMIFGYLNLRRNMKEDWLSLTEKTLKIKELKTYWDERYEKSKNIFDWRDIKWLKHLPNHQKSILDWKEVEHIIVVAISKERLDVLDPTFKALAKLNYPTKKIIVVIGAEELYKKTSSKDIAVLKNRYAKYFRAFKCYYHTEKEGEVRPGKGPNITNAGKKFWAEYKNKLNPKKVLVTNIDCDHILHKEYLGHLTYFFVTDPSRTSKTYQPIPLLFNNIWDVPAMNRIGAISSSFWQLVENMRPYRLRTFAAHTQSLSLLLASDFWSVKTIVEDGHQYWRSYFAVNGNHHMIPLYIPVYQDAVMGETVWDSIKNHYKQKRRWAWGITDFPYVVTQSMKHKEIPLFERLLQIFRLISGHVSWASSSFILAFAWIPLSFNKHFQDTVLAHNISAYSSQMLQLAWIGVLINIWLSMLVMPPRPKNYSFIKNISMVLQWILGPIYTVVLSALPALEAQTRLVLNKPISWYITPKSRKTTPKYS